MKPTEGELWFRLSSAPFPVGDHLRDILERTPADPEAWPTEFPPVWGTFYGRVHRIDTRPLSKDGPPVRLILVKLETAELDG